MITMEKPTTFWQSFHWKAGFTPPWKFAQMIISNTDILSLFFYASSTICSLLGMESFCFCQLSIVSSWVHSSLIAPVSLGTNEMSFFFSKFFIWFKQFSVELVLGPLPSLSITWKLCCVRNAFLNLNPAESACTWECSWKVAGVNPELPDTAHN